MASLDEQERIARSGQTGGSMTAHPVMEARVMPKGLPGWAAEMGNSLDLLEGEMRYLEQALEPILHIPEDVSEKASFDPEGASVAMVSPVAGALAARDATIRKLAARVRRLRFQLDLPDVEEPF